MAWSCQQNESVVSVRRGTVASRSEHGRFHTVRCLLDLCFGVRSDDETHPHPLMPESVAVPFTQDVNHQAAILDPCVCCRDDDDRSRSSLDDGNRSLPNVRSTPAAVADRDALMLACAVDPRYNVYIPISPPHCLSFGMSVLCHRRLLLIYLIVQILGCGRAMESDMVAKNESRTTQGNFE